nr:MAG TPA: tail length tape measure protein [Caudoviricetes sp.]
MGKIHNVFSLEDRFSSTFGRYLQLAQQASGQTLTAKAAAQSYSVSVQTEAANMAQAAQIASVQQQTAVQAAAASSQQTAAVHTQAAQEAIQAVQRVAAASQQNAAVQEQAAQEVIRTQQQLSAVQSEASASVARHSEALKAAEASARNYQSVLGSIERQVIKANARFDALYEQEQELIAAGEQTTAAFKKLDAQLDKQGASVRFLEAQQAALTQKYNAIAAAVQNENAALSRAQAAQTQAAQAATSAASAAQELASAQTDAAEASGQAASAMRQASDAAEQAASAAGQAADTADQAAAAAKRASNANREFEDSSGLAAKAANSLTQELKKLVGGYLGIQTLKKAADLSDTLVSTRTRLDQMNDGLQTTAELETMIYQAAQDSRGSFVDTLGLVSQLGTMAGSAFDNTQEVVLFAEQLNKKLALSGAFGMAAQAAILQLEQGLASGVLRGDELNSVMEQTPALAKTIADYLQVSIGDLRTMGSEGKITAAIVKNALFSAAEETNAAFEKTPMTWAQVWTTVTNIAVRALDPLLSGINWVANNIDALAPIVLTTGSAFGVMLIAANWTNILTFATQKAAAAQAFLNAVMAANPAALAAAGVLLLVGALYAGVALMNHFAGTSVSATGIIAGSFAVMGAFVYNSTLVPLQNGFAMFVNFLGNAFNNPTAAVKILFYDMAITVMQYLQNIAGALEGLVNMVPGVTVDLTSGLDSWVTKLKRDRQYEKWASGYTEYVTPWENMDLSKAYTKGYNWGANLSFSDLFSGLLGNGMGDLAIPQAANLNDLLKNIDKNTSKIAKTVDMSDEQIKMLVDVAERKYVNNINLTSQTPMITIKGQNTGNTEQDARNVAEILRDTLLELRSAGSTVTVQ